MEDDTKKIENSVSEYIRTEKLCQQDQNILMAVSGGADSVAMAEILSRNVDSGKLKANLHIAHINHQLRLKDSDKDEIFVRKLAKKLALPITTKTVAVKEYAAKAKISIETAARKLRIDALKKIAREYNCKTIAVAHHADDNAETLLQRMMRGTAFAGLAGIWPKKEFSDASVFIRPMLELNSEQIVNYLKQRQLIWRTDKTNDDCRFTRNFIRHKLIPAMQQDCTEPLRQSLTGLARACRELEARVKKLAIAAMQHCVCDEGRLKMTLKRSPLLKLAEPVRVEIIKIVLEKIGCGQQKFTSNHYRKILEFMSNAKKEKNLSLPNNFLITADSDDEVTLAAAIDEPEKKIAPVQIAINGVSEFGQWKIKTKIMDAKQCDFEKFKTEKNEYIEWIDLEKVTLPLIAREREDGDRFVPIGQKNSQKVGKFITAAKISKKNKKKLFLITDSKNIIWLAPVRLAANAAITDKAVKIVQIKTCCIPPFFR